MGRCWGGGGGVLGGECACAFDNKYISYEYFQTNKDNLTIQGRLLRQQMGGGWGSYGTLLVI